MRFLLLLAVSLLVSSEALAQGRTITRNVARPGVSSSYGVRNVARPSSRPVQSRAYQYRGVRPSTPPPMSMPRGYESTLYGGIPYRGGVRYSCPPPMSMPRNYCAPRVYVPRVYVPRFNRCWRPSFTFGGRLGVINVQF